MVPKTKKEASALPKAEAKPKALESKESSAERHPQPRTTRDPHITHLSVAKDIVAAGSPNILGRAPPGGTSLTTMLCHHHVPPDYRVSLEEDRRQ